MLLAVAVGAFVAGGSSLVDLIGQNPPQPDEFDVRRVEFEPGEIRVRVTNPQTDDLTIASVTVDDAIVPFDVDGDATLGRLRSSTVVIPFEWVEDDPITVGITSSTGIETIEEIPAAVETPGLDARRFLGYAIIGFLVGVLPVGARPPLAAVAAARAPGVADGVHGADRRAALVPRRRGALRGVRAPGRACRARSAGPGSCCSASLSAT